MTPQLQQAIRLLQLSTLELKAEVQEALESNPMLDLSEEAEAEQSGTPTADSGAGTSQSPSQSDPGNSDSAGGTEAAASSEMASEIPEDLPVDTSWEDVYDTGGTVGPAPSSAGSDSDMRGIEVQGSASESLKDHLLWQLDLTPFSDLDRMVAEALVDAINEDGYLSLSLEELHQGLVEQGHDLELDEVEAVLHRIQNFDPPGVAARDLRECLLLQLKQLPSATPWLKQALSLVGEHLHLLGSRDFNQLMRRMKLAQSDLESVLHLIQSLNPRPGGSVSQEAAEYVVPDVIVRKHRGAWRVELNEEAMPRLRINNHYASLVRRADTSSDNTYLKNQLQEARWFIKSLQSRHETLLKVASCIVGRQRGFLEHGEEAMQPLVLHDVAEEVGMHESTISRVTNKKYMMTPRGIFELKYFFSSHVGTASGGACSATAIRALIKKLVAAESPRKPLSDSKIAAILSDQGINVARRTVAKYREAMSIPPSNERKRLV